MKCHECENQINVKDSKYKECPNCKKQMLKSSFLTWFGIARECHRCREEKGIQAFIELAKMVDKHEMS